MDDTSRPSVSDEEVLSVIARHDSSPLRPPHVADDLPVGTEPLRDRFEDLAEQGLLERIDAGLDVPVWALTPEGESAADVPDEEIVTDIEAPATLTDTDSRPVDQETVESPPPEPAADVAGRPYEPPTSFLETFDPPGNPEQKERRRAALGTAVAYLRGRDRATRGDFVDDVFPNARGAYEEPTDGWWEEVIRPGLEYLPGPTRDEGDGWRFDEDAAGRERDDPAADS